MGSRAQSKERQIILISKSLAVVKGEEQENQKAGIPLMKRESAVTRRTLPPHNVGRAQGSFRGGALYPSPVTWIYMTVKYDTRSAVPALLVTRLVTA